MPQYILRNLPESLWARVRARAAQDGWPLRPLILDLLEQYASGQIRPAGVPPERPESASD